MKKQAFARKSLQSRRRIYSRYRPLQFAAAPLRVQEFVSTIQGFVAAPDSPVAVAAGALRMHLTGWSLRCRTVDVK